MFLAKNNDIFNYILKILISGGAELLFGKVKKHNVVLPEAEKPCIKVCILNEF